VVFSEVKWWKGQILRLGVLAFWLRIREIRDKKDCAQRSAGRRTSWKAGWKAAHAADADFQESRKWQRGIGSSKGSFRKSWAFLSAFFPISLRLIHGEPRLNTGNSKLHRANSANWLTGTTRVRHEAKGLGSSRTSNPRPRRSGTELELYCPAK
jgi:hypothetical protein